VRRVEFFPVPIEEHDQRVTWTAPFEMADGIDPKNLEIAGELMGQICQDEGACIPLDALETRFVAQYAGPVSRSEPPPAPPSSDRPAGSGFRAAGTHTVLGGHITPRVGAPGEQVTLVLTATPDPGWHVYARKEGEGATIGFSPTAIGLRLPPGWTVTAPLDSSPPVTKPSGIEGYPDVRYHEGPVRWSLPLEIPADTLEGVYDITGLVGYQACDESSCDMPAGAEFSVQLSVAAEPLQGQQGLQWAAADYGQATKLSDQTPFQTAAPGPVAADSGGLDLERLDAEAFASKSPLAIVMLTAFAAGFILNFMPCVLPVVGLKIMAFVQQAGESRTRVFVLNLWYCLGLIFVFMVLANLAVLSGLGWGEQFTSATFNIVLAAIVFVFALSLLGIWEIPIPGFVGSGTVQDLADEEGASGAFFKGMLTTVLATPCSGPLLAPALAFFVSQPPLVTYLGFLAVGLGMAFPYLLIGAFPQLISFLPKPGAWMETFKHVMGFVLLGTVVFLLTFLDVPYVVPTVGFLVGLWAAFWWIGRVPLTETLDRKLKAWAAGTVFSIMIGLFSFGWLVDVMEARFQRAVDREVGSRQTAAGESELPWQPYSLALLQKLTAEQQTVLVDFTADW
jgi:thiol:disulfide interchange protein